MYMCVCVLLASMVFANGRAHFIYKVFYMEIMTFPHMLSLIGGSWNRVQLPQRVPMGLIMTFVYQ